MRVHAVVKVERLLLLVLVLFPLRRGPRGGTLVLLTPGASNIGDQAMYEAVLHRVAGPVTAVAPVADGFDHSTGLERPDTQYLHLPGLLHGRLAHVRDVWRFARELRRASRLLVVGADVLDGAYSAIASYRTWTLAELAVRQGCPDVRMLGFSWNHAPADVAVRAAKAARAVGVRCFVRDPRSLSRFQSDVGSAIGAADIVFGDPGTVKSRTLFEAKPFCVINVSALIAAKYEMVAPIQDLIDDLISSELRVLILPHVSHPNSNDREVCERVYQRYGADPRVALASDVRTPDEVRSVVSGSIAVVTGRMHLAVMALSQGVPTIVMSTQGKVEGLLELLGIPELCIDPGELGSGRLKQVVRYTLQEDLRIREVISSQLPTVTRLADLNFEAIEQ